MTQPTTKRLVTEAALTTKLNTEFPARLNKLKQRQLGDQFRGVRPGAIVPSSKAVVSLTVSPTFDGYVAGGAQAWTPAQMYDIAECNWNAATLTTYGTAYTNSSKSNTNTTAFDFTTMFEGSYLLLCTYKLAGLKQDIRIWIDDQEVNDWYLGTRASGVLQSNNNTIAATTDGSNHFININFNKRGVYKVRVAGIGITGTSSIIACNAEGKLHKPRKMRTLGIISDSWYDTIALHSSLNAGETLAARMGWIPWNMANSGTGFVNPGSSAGASVGNPMNFGSDNVFASLVKAPELDLLLLNGSANDMAYPEADVIAAMNAFFTRWRTVRPDTPIVWKGMEPVSYFENLYTSAALIARENALATAALADANVIGVIRPSLENWITGTGNIVSPNGTGTQDYNTGSDGTHLSVAGIIMDGALTHERLSPIPTWRV